MKKLLSVILCFSILLSLLSGAAIAADSPSTWAAEQINTAINANLVPSALQSNYTQSITRAEFCSLAVTLYEAVTGKAVTERKAFDDTKDVNVEKMAALGVVSGVGDNKFSPDNQLTREQAATMLSRLADVIGSPLPKQAATFADNGNIASWAIEQVGHVQAAGIMSGVGDNNFSPQGSYTREQSMVTMLRLRDKVVGKPTSTNSIFSDNGYWDNDISKWEEYIKKYNLTTSAYHVLNNINNNLDKVFNIHGNAYLSDYFEHKYKDLADDFFSAAIVNDDYTWYVYFDKKTFSQLYNALNGQYGNGKLWLHLMCEIPSDYYADGQGAMAIVKYASPSLGQWYGDKPNPNLTPAIGRSPDPKPSMAITSTPSPVPSSTIKINAPYISKNSRGIDTTWFYYTTGYFNGVYLTWEAEHNCIKEIKYCNIYVKVYNRVGDVIADETNNATTTVIELVGPVGAGSRIRYANALVGFFPNAYKIVIDKIELELMDGTKEVVIYGYETTDWYLR